jgi:hypothetical protein
MSRHYPKRALSSNGNPNRVQRVRGTDASTAEQQRALQSGGVNIVEGDGARRNCIFSRGDKTAIELFVAGVRAMPEELMSAVKALATTSV